MIESIGTDVRRVTPVLAAIVLLASLAIACVKAAAADATIATITQATATPDWTRGNLAGSVTYDCPATPCAWSADAALEPTLYTCADVTFGDLIGSGGDPNIKVIWLAGEGWSGPNGTGEFLSDQFHSSGSVSFNLPNYPILSGVYGQRLCLFISELVVDVEIRRPVAQRNLVVTTPAPPTPPPSSSMPTTFAPAKSPVLSRGSAERKVKTALARKFGRSYRHGKHKRLSCNRLSSTSYRCRYSFTYRRKRRAGVVFVRVKPGGLKVTFRSALSPNATSTIASAMYTSGIPSKRWTTSQSSRETLAFKARPSPSS